MRSALASERGVLMCLSPEELDALVEIAEAARLIQAFDQAGGNDWWEAHAKLYAALARHDLEGSIAAALSAAPTATHQETK